MLAKPIIKIATLVWVLFCCIVFSCGKGVVLKPVAGAPTNLVITASSTKTYNIYIQLQYPGQIVELDDRLNLTAPYKNVGDVKSGNVVVILMQSAGVYTYTITYKDSVIVSRTVNGAVNPSVAVGYQIP